ncbi:DMT family transporter [Photorhabdus laumondii]|uniref:EamA-like transporter family protein n=1 Tax=Photorhabdus laumondii subsp. clarkei TaxID=2029685 RepID=A0A329VPL1_9GAMM|nr:DMT family transporter [Photorhabdus laumondii]RAW93679.1 hypothetical protein CKY01_01810 [Photorhabdus laumondii subsp. clarkei]
MLILIFIAFLNGIFIAATRTINGQLSVSMGSFGASLWNHIGGFFLLTVILTLLSSWQWNKWDFNAIPTAAYMGGVFGALFVAVSSYIFPKLGAMNAAVLVIAGQMLSAVLLDWLYQGMTPGLVKIVGVLFVLIGIYLTRKTTELK